MTDKEIVLIDNLLPWFTENLWYIESKDVESHPYFGTTIEENETIKGPFIYIYAKEDELQYFKGLARKTIGIDKMKILKNADDGTPIVIYKLENTDEE